MVNGQNILRCIKCGAVSLGTDYIDLSYMCSECKEKFDSETKQSLKYITDMITGKQPEENLTPAVPVWEKPLQALWVANIAMLADILADRKRITIRFGYKDYKVDKAVFVVVCDFNVVTVAVVKQLKSVKWKKLCELTKEEIEADGFKDLNDALNGLQRFYPEIGLDSPITVIEW